MADGGLPTAAAAAVAAADGGADPRHDPDDVDPPPSCCAWGGHTAAEVGTSWLLPPLPLLAWRAALAAWVVGTLAWLAAADELDMVYFTNVNYTLLCGVLVATAAVTAYAVLVVRPPPHPSRRGGGGAAAAAAPPAVAAEAGGGGAKRADGAGPVWTATVLAFQVAASNALFLDVVYWALLFDTLSFSTTVVHLLNALVVGVDIALVSSMHLRWAYLLPSAAVALLWVFGFAWPWYAATGEWVYGFLDFREHSTAYTVGIYVGMTAWHLVAGALVVGLCRLREWAVYRRRRQRGGAGGRAPAAGEEAVFV